MDKFYMVTFPKTNPSFYGEKEIIYAKDLDELHSKLRKWGKNPKEYQPEVIA